MTGAAPRRPAALGALALAVAALLAVVAGRAGAAPAAWTNPRLNPVGVAVHLTAPASLRLEVERRGAVAYRAPAVAAGAGTTVLRWSGQGADVDARYSVVVRDAATGLPAAAPVQALVDVHAPRVRLVVPAPAIPPAAPALVVRAPDVERGGVSVRWRMAGAVMPGAAGRWRAWAGPADTPVLLAALRSARAVGPLRVALEARDRAGNDAVSAEAWVDPATGPTPPLIVVRRVITRRPWVALTFDDGYSAPSIASILATMERLRVRATFCFNGTYVPRWPAALRAAIARAADEGLLGVCSHGYSHRTSRSTSFAFDLADLRQEVVWDRVAGVSTIPVYRPPGGDHGPALEAAAHQLGYRYLLLWSVDPRDWDGRSASQVTADVLRGASPGAIVIEHAIPASAQALPAIVAGLRARGLVPVRVNDLLAAGRPGV